MTFIKIFVAKHRKFVLYGLIGLTGALLDFLLYILFYEALGMPPFLASFVSVSFGIINNFMLNAYYNFKKSDNIFIRGIVFYLTGIGGAILSSALIWLMYDVVGIGAVSAKLLTIPPVVILQYFINKQVSFSANLIDSLKNIRK